MGLGSDVGTMGVLHGEGEVGSTTGSCRPMRAALTLYLTKLTNKLAL